MSTNHVKRTLRIFVSSVGQMMSAERETLRSQIWKSGHFPIAMESFSGNHAQNSIEVVIENLQQADVIIFVLGFTYGNIIGKGLKCSKCPLEKAECKYRKARNTSCPISYTHFEYLFAKKNNILRYCIVQKDIEDGMAFEKRLNTFFDGLSSYGSDNIDKKKSKIKEMYYAKKKEQTDLAKDKACSRWVYFYDANDENIVAQISELYNTIYRRFESEAPPDSGLVDYKTIVDISRDKNREIEELKKQCNENDITASTLRKIVLESRTDLLPNTAVTGTCIPFRYDEKNDELVTFLVSNSAYEDSNNRLMFPGGHAFSNDESPEAIAISKALVEAGLSVKTVDLYKSFDMSGHSEKSITENFTVFRPPHYTYFFKQNDQAKCWKRNHHYHYDAVYVVEVAEVGSMTMCTQERVEVRLPNKQMNVPSIREAMNNAIKEFNERQLKNGGIVQEIGDYLVQMLYEAHRDYVKYLSSEKR